MRESHFSNWLQLSSIAEGGAWLRAGGKPSCISCECFHLFFPTISFVRHLSVSLSLSLTLSLYLSQSQLQFLTWQTVFRFSPLSSQPPRKWMVACHVVQTKWQFMQCQEPCPLPAPCPQSPASRSRHTSPEALDTMSGQWQVNSGRKEQKKTHEINERKYAKKKMEKHETFV